MTRDPSQPASNEDSAPGLLSRLTSSLRDRFASADTGAAAQTPALDPRLAPWAAKVKSAADAVEQIAGGSHVFIGTACATPTALVGALEAMRYPPADVEFVHFITNQAVPHDADGKAITKYQHRTFFVGSDIRAAVKQGLAEYVPMSISRVPQLIGNGRIRVDVALIQVSMPDEFGYVSLGVSVDVIPAAIAKAKLVIAEVNPAMPRTMGDSMVHVDRIDTLVPVATPVAEYVAARDRGPDRRAHRALHQRHHRGRLDAADRPGPRAQRGAEVPGRPQGPRHPLGRHHRRHHPAAGKGHPHRAPEVEPARQDRRQLRRRLAAAVRPDRPQPAVLVPAHRRGVPPHHHRRAAPDGVGDAGLRHRPDRAGVRRPARRRVLQRHRGAGRVFARRVALARRQGDHLPRVHRRRRRHVAGAGDAGRGGERHRRPRRRPLRDHRARHRVPLRQVDPRARRRADRRGASQVPRRAVRAGAGAGLHPGRADAEEPARLPGGGGADGDAEGQADGAAAARRCRPTAPRSATSSTACRSRT